MSSLVTTHLYFFFFLYKLSEVFHFFQNPNLLKLGGETKELTFLFSDIRGFTPISEKYQKNPQGLTIVINKFLTPMTNIIMNNGGTIDKYMGDCIMAFWNAPIENKKHRELAVKSALEMNVALKELNMHLQAEGLPKIKLYNMQMLI